MIITLQVPYAWMKYALKNSTTKEISETYAIIRFYFL